MRQRAEIGYARVTLSTARRHRFCCDVTEYAALVDECDTTPVLLPAESWRAGRWREVLGGLSGGPPPRDAGAHAVASLGGEYELVARVFARRTTREYLGVVDEPRLLAAVADRNRDSLLVVAPPHALKVELLRQLQAAECRWGVLTGRDLPAATFVAAKLLDGPAPREHGYLVCGEGVALEGPGHEPGPLEPQQLGGTPRSTLLIDAHGEGAHLNLGSVVICGLPDEVERDSTGIVAGGCSSVDGVAHCKRSHGKTTVVLARELEADDLVVLSCCGFSIAGEGYPSSVSLVLAALEGRARSVMASDRIAGFATWVIPLLAQVCRGRGLGPLWVLVGEIEVNTRGGRSYVLVGDPAQGLGDLPRLDSGPVQVPPPGAIFELGVLADASVIAPSAAVPMLRGMRHAAIRTEHPLSLSVRDASVDLEIAEEWLSTVWSHRHHARHLELGLVAHLEGSPQPAEASTEAAAGLDARRSLADAGALVDARVRTMLWALGVTATEGVYGPGVDGAIQATLAAVAAWDGALARLCHAHIGLEDFYFIVAKGVASGLREETGVRCARCSNLVVRVEGHLPGAPSLWFDECPACSICGLCVEGGPRLELSMPHRVGPGTRVTLHIDLHDGPHSNGWIVVEIKDKARGSMLIRDLIELRGHHHELALDLPNELSPDLHSASALWVGELRFAWARCRFAAG